MKNSRTLKFSPLLIGQLASLCVMTFILAACGSAPTSVEMSQEIETQNPVTGTPSESPSIPVDGSIETVTVGTFGISSDAAVFIAMERGYFKEQGIEVETSQFTALSDMIPALATGQLDVGNANVGAALYNALGSEYGLKIVADNATIELGNDGSALVVRPELAAGIQSPTDLKGLKIAAAADKGTPAHVCLEKLLVPAGMTASDLTMIQIPYPAMAAALANESVDGAIIVEPFLSTGLSLNLFVIYKGTGEMCPGDEVNVQVYSANFAGKTDIARRFALARLKGARDFNDAFFKNIGRDEVVDILSRYTALTDPKLYADVRFTTMDPDGKVNIESLGSYLAWYVEHGFVKETFDLSAAIDSSFSENAVNVLGAYK